MAGTAEFDIKGVKYRANPMDARKQFHIALKVAAVTASFGSYKDPAAALAHLSPDDADMVINTCLAVIERRADGGEAWSPIMAANGMLMFEDIRTSLAILIQLVVPVMEANADDFFSQVDREWFGSLITRVMSKVTS